MAAQAGDTRPTQTLVDLARQGAGTDVLLLQSMGPILDFAALPHNSQYLLNVSQPAALQRFLHAPAGAVDARLKLSPVSLLNGS